MGSDLTDDRSCESKRMQDMEILSCFNNCVLRQWSSWKSDHGRPRSHLQGPTRTLHHLSRCRTLCITFQGHQLEFHTVVSRRLTLLGHDNSPRTETCCRIQLSTHINWSFYFIFFKLSDHFIGCPPRDILIKWSLSSSLWVAAKGRGYNCQKGIKFGKFNRQVVRCIWADKRHVIP